MEENKKPENPMAFPVVGDSHSQNYLQEGMSLRDYFAAKAMQCYLKFAIENNGASDKVVAELSFKTADAMLKARKQ